MMTVKELSDLTGISVCTLHYYDEIGLFVPTGKKEICSEEIQKLAAEYDSITRQMFQLPDATKMGLELAQLYQSNKEIQAAQDSIYGAGVTEFAGKVLEAYYGGITSSGDR